jgi:hypothetical protein
MSTLNVDKVDPSTGTALELGTSGDTITVPTGAGLTVTDEVKTNKVSPATGTAFALGDSGDTFTVPSGAILTITGTIGGTLTPGSSDAYDLGAAGAIWRDIYTGDLNLTNRGKEKGNEVDGTKGSWTIQEGENDLFIMNKVSGKKFKFKLEEVM